MCSYCEENNGEPIGCQDCGCMICDDVEPPGDDILAPSFVTSSGDLFCYKCGLSNQHEIDAQEEEESEDWGYEDDDDWYEIIEEEEDE